MASITIIKQATEQFVHDVTVLPFDQSLDSALENAFVAEYELRLLYGAGHQIEDPLLGLIDIFSLYPISRRTRARQAQQGTRAFAERYVLPLGAHLRRSTLTSSTVFNIRIFQKHWEIFAHNVLSKMRDSDWNNVVAAGGSVLACLMAPEPNSNERSLNEYFQSSIYASSDIDLFLWGLTPEQAEVKMQDIYKAVCAAAPWKVTCIRRGNAVSIHTSYPYRPIRIALRLYQSPAEILAGFDIDASCCAYDGSAVFVNARALAALVRQCNTVDITHQSPSYEARLAKYAQRGFEVYIPSLDRERVKSSLYDKNLREYPNGLARLLVLEAAIRNPDLYKNLRYRNAGRLSLQSNDYGGEACRVRIPYGPAWDADKITRMMSRLEGKINCKAPVVVTRLDLTPDVHQRSIMKVECTIDTFSSQVACANASSPIAGTAARIKSQKIQIQIQILNHNPTSEVQ